MHTENRAAIHREAVGKSASNCSAAACLPSLVLAVLTALLIVCPIPVLADTSADGYVDPTNNGTEVDGNGFFGQTIAITPDLQRIMVGAPGNDLLYVFDNGPGGYQRTIALNSQGAMPVAADSEMEIVGYSTSGGEHGVYNLRNDGNIDDFLFQNLDAAPEALAMYPGVIAVGMPSYAADAGRVRVYRYNGQFDQWISDLPIDGAAAGDRLGTSLAFTSTGAFLLAGAPDAGANGEVEMFFDDSGTWVSYQTVAPPSDFDSQSGARFGHSISVNGDWLAIGAPLANRIFGGIGIPAIDGGIVSLFEFDFLSFVHRQRLQGNIDGANVGASVSISSTGGSKLLVLGAPGEGNNRMGRVKAYVLGGGGVWVFEDNLLGGLREGDEFGTTVASVGRMVVVGAPYWDYCAPGAQLCTVSVGIAALFRGFGVLFEDGFESGDTSLWN